MQELEASLARLRSAWMAGGSALDHCPDTWRDAVTGPHGEAALAALVGHATAVLFRTAPSSPLEARPLLPVLGLPVMADELRSRFRRILSTKDGPAIERHLVDLIAARGFGVHPADWLPSPSDEWVPDLYMPWLDWVRAESSAAAEDSNLTAETYDRWSWAARRAALAQLRGADPAAALAIIAAKAATEPAERRLLLLEILETKLSEIDAPFLESLSEDRSERVRGLVRAYLARLGKVTGAGELATELAAMLEIGKVGLIRRRTHLVIKPLNTAAQNARREALFKLVSMAELSRELGLSELQCVEAPPEGRADGIEAFARMIAATGSDAALRAWLDGVLADDSLAVSPLRALAPRLPAAERRALLPQIMARDSAELETTLALAGRELGAAPVESLWAAPAFAALNDVLGKLNDGADAQRAQLTATAGVLLNRIALLLDAPGAAAMAARLIQDGMSPADPKLDLLRLNAALESNNA